VPRTARILWGLGAPGATGGQPAASPAITGLIYSVAHAVAILIHEAPPATPSALPPSAPTAPSTPLLPAFAPTTGTWLTVFQPVTTTIVVGIHEPGADRTIASCPVLILAVGHSVAVVIGPPGGVGLRGLVASREVLGP